MLTLKDEFHYHLFITHLLNICYPVRENLKQNIIKCHVIELIGEKLYEVINLVFI